jgi:NADPH-dependent curcumin reductase CurA
LVGLQEYVTINSAEARHFQKIPSVPSVPDSAFLGVLGVTGLTAYFGMTDIAKPQSGETLVVSAAAGATGSVAGQIGKIHGCRVVGIAGSDEKCKWLVEELGFDAAINYKHADWKEKLAAATPKGIDIDFENVGGEVMHAVLGRMNLHGRVVLCGLISSYAKEDPALESFSTIIVKRLRVQGFLIIDYVAKFTEGVTQLGQWKMLGKIKDRETMLEGLEKVSEAINMLFTGANTGKLIVKVS